MSMSYSLFLNLVTYLKVKNVTVDGAVQKLNDLHRIWEVEGEEPCWIKLSSCTLFLSQRLKNEGQHEDIYQFFRYWEKNSGYQKDDYMIPLVVTSQTYNLNTWCHIAWD